MSHNDIQLTKDVTTSGEECWVATHPAYPGCVGYGHSQEEAVRIFKAALPAYESATRRRSVSLAGTTSADVEGLAPSTDWRTVMPEAAWEDDPIEQVG